MDLPSWLAFPDVERVGWVNTVVKQLWPHIARAVQARRQCCLVTAAGAATSCVCARHMPSNFRGRRPMAELFPPAVVLCIPWARLELSQRHSRQLLAADSTVFSAGTCVAMCQPQSIAEATAVQDAVEAQMGPLLRDNKPRWLGDVKMTRFTMGSKVPQHHGLVAHG